MPCGMTEEDFGLGPLDCWLGRGWKYSRDWLWTAHAPTVNDCQVPIVEVCFASFMLPFRCVRQSIFIVLPGSTTLLGSVSTSLVRFLEKVSFYPGLSPVLHLSAVPVRFRFTNIHTTRLTTGATTCRASLTVCIERAQRAKAP